MRDLQALGSDLPSPISNFAAPIPAQPPRCLGLALGGGVVRGYAHLGVLSVLQREHIPVKVVSGASAGALIGALYCAGVPTDFMLAAAMRLKWWNIARPVFPLRGFVSFEPMERWVRGVLGDLKIEDLKIPFAIVATDLYQGEPVVFRQGQLAPAVRASCSVPGFVVPAEIEGRLLCDGGISDNLPVAAARELGADYVIGVNLFDPLVDHPRHIFTLGFAAIETMVRRAGGGLHTCDLLISPNLVGATYLRMSKRQQLIEKGEIAAEAMLPQIRAALQGRTYDDGQVTQELEPVSAN